MLLVSFAGILYCSDEKQVADIVSQSYKVDGNSMHDDGTDDYSLSREHIFERHRVRVLFCR